MEFTAEVSRHIKNLFEIMLKSEKLNRMPCIYECNITHAGCISYLVVQFDSEDMLFYDCVEG